MSSWKSRREAHKLFESVSQLEDLLNKLLVYFLTLFGIIRLSFYLIRSYLLYMTHFFPTLCISGYGETRNCLSPTTLPKLLQQLGFNPRLVEVEYNGEY